MNLSVEKLEIIRRICEIQDNDLIDLIKSIVSDSDATESDWWSLVSQQEKDAINRGLEDLKQGKVVTHDQVKQKYEKWL